MKQLHYHPGNASLAPHMLLREIGEPFELVLVDRAANAHRQPDYLRLNPNGQIPVLVDGDLVLYESAAILLYLCDDQPGLGLAPALGTRERAHCYKWLMWMTNTLQAALMIYFYPGRWLDETRPNHEATCAELRSRAEQKIAGMLDIVEAELARHGGPWFLGDRFSALDPFLTMLGRWTRGHARPARSLPQLGAYLQRMLARPAVAKAFIVEGLPQPWV